MYDQVKQMLNDMVENSDPPEDWVRGRRAWQRRWLQAVEDAAHELRHARQRP